MLINIGYHYCTLVMFTVSQRCITGPEPICPESSLTLSLLFLSTMAVPCRLHCFRSPAGRVRPVGGAGQIMEGRKRGKGRVFPSLLPWVTYAAVTVCSIALHMPNRPTVILASGPFFFPLADMTVASC